MLIGLGGGDGPSGVDEHQILPVRPAVVDVHAVRIALTRDYRPVLQGLLHAVQNGLVQLVAVIDVELLLLLLRRSGEEGTGLPKADSDPAFPGGDLPCQVQVPAGELGHLGHYALRRDHALFIQCTLVGLLVLLKLVVHTNIERHHLCSFSLAGLLFRLGLRGIHLGTLALVRIY